MGSKLADRILRHMQESDEEEFFADALAEATGATEDEVTEALQRLRDEGSVHCPFRIRRGGMAPVTLVR